MKTTIYNTHHIDLPANKKDRISKMNHVWIKKSVTGTKFSAHFGCLQIITGWSDKIVVLKLYFKTFIEKINSGNNHHLDTDPELGACFFHKRRRELCEYLADGSDQAGFGVGVGHVGDVLDV